MPTPVSANNSRTDVVFIPGISQSCSIEHRKVASYVYFTVKVFYFYFNILYAGTYGANHEFVVVVRNILDVCAFTTIIVNPPGSGYSERASNKHRCSPWQHVSRREPIASPSICQWSHCRMEGTKSGLYTCSTNGCHYLFLVYVKTASAFYDFFKSYLFYMFSPLFKGNNMITVSKVIISSESSTEW